MVIRQMLYLTLMLSALAACGEPPLAPTEVPATPAPQDKSITPTQVAPTAMPSGLVRVGGEGVAEQPYTPHVDLGAEHAPYNSIPATSGKHTPFTGRWGVHEQFIPDEVLVHNLEHGGVGIHYDCPQGCDELVKQLAALVVAAVEGDKKVIMSPYPRLDTTIALTAWTFIDKLDDFDADRIMSFIEAHESSLNAPEPLVR